MLIDRELADEVNAALVKKDPPEVLWHYTNVGAARAILKSRSVHLCCHAFMNDPAEGTVAGEIVSKCWANAVDQSSSHPCLNLAYVRNQPRVLEYFDFGRRELPPTFLFSLTELHDSLSQWSRYGDDGAGVALGFSINASALPMASERPWSTGVDLVRVDYDGADTNGSSNMRTILARLLPKYVARFRSPVEIENTLISLIHQLSPRLKRFSYSEEREWRIITRTVIESVELYDVKCGRLGVVPFVPLSLGDGIRLSRLMLGPKLSPENAWSASWLCKKLGYDPDITTSGLAYR